MAEVFIPGWQSEISIMSEDLTVVGNVIGFARSRAANAKAVFGQPYRRELGGQASGTISVSGHFSQGKAQALESIFDSPDPVDFEMQAGTPGASTDAGVWTGSLVITGYNLDSSAEGEWDWSMEATLDGAPLFTPGTPA